MATVASTPGAVAVDCTKLAPTITLIRSAAAFITLMLSLTFVQSTALPPGARGGTAVFVQIQPQHAWFGQPEPAVLVD